MEEEMCATFLHIMPKRQKKQSERGDSSVQTARLSTKGRFRKTDRSHPANREITQQWDIHDDDFYEQMRGVEICPSRFAHRDTTDALGITEDIEALFEKIGLGYIFDLHCDCYADLTRQFLASARLYHPDEDNPVADKAMFSFIVNRQFHSMTIFQLCDVFGFGKDVNLVFLTSRNTMISGHSSLQETSSLERPSKREYVALSHFDLRVVSSTSPSFGSISLDFDGTAASSGSCVR
ncbi:hypothetical protein HID58_045468 [Brassica napus]|uniref:Arabidopsis retrotransposon Orf1 C-terminal domain-containing protein n=1 Tax=Brassica napus TaxID=3708 RepID=A0ABQ8AV43_BRANA|nr:hypothetical protein HID58_045468 [Brassica napus]